MKFEPELKLKRGSKTNVKTVLDFDSVFGYTFDYRFGLVLECSFGCIFGFVFRLKLGLVFGIKIESDFELDFGLLFEYDFGSEIGFKTGLGFEMRRQIVFRGDFDFYFEIDRQTGISLQEACDFGILKGSKIEVSSKKFFSFVDGAGCRIIFPRLDPRKLKKLLRRTSKVASKNPRKILENMSGF